MNELVFIRDMGLAADGHKIAEYECACGARFIAIKSRVRFGRVVRCMECARKIIKQKITKHGDKGSYTYNSWQAMKTRCLNRSDKDYPRYGGKGITIYQPWIDSYEAFLAYMGPRPPDTSIDRIDGTKGYEPGNVRWATALEQGENHRNIVFIPWHGEPTRVKYIAKELGISEGAVHLRYKRGKLREPE